MLVWLIVLYKEVFGDYGLYLSVNHGDSYLLDVSLKGIIAQYGNVDTYIAFSHSNVLININKLASFNGSFGLKLYGYRISLI